MPHPFPVPQVHVHRPAAREKSPVGPVCFGDMVLSKSQGSILLSPEMKNIY